MAIEIEKPRVGLSKMATSDTHGEDSPYFAGWKAYDEDPFDEVHNPSGVIQMGLAENQVDTIFQYLGYIFTCRIIISCCLINFLVYVGVI